MTILSIVVVLIVIGLVMWAIRAVGILQPQIIRIIDVVLIVGAVLYVLNGFGLIGGHIALH